MSDDERRLETSQDDQPHVPKPAVIEADDLFRGTREVWIEHAGVCYRLRITRRNKLILQK
jgi:hemin uptake protein HemP